MVKKVLFVMLIFILIYTLNSEKSYNQENILIASSIPQSGALKDWGESVFETTNSYFKYVNDNKLIENRKIFFKKDLINSSILNKDFLRNLSTV